MELKEESSVEVSGLEIPEKLQELLPCGYSYKLKKWTAFENKPNQFEAVIFTNVYTEDEAQEWWHEFNVKSNTTMRVRATCPKTGKVNIFKIYLRCLHQGRAEKTEKLERRHRLKTALPAKRNTNCPAGMIIAIRRLVKYSRSKLRDPVDPVHPCEVQLRFVHNHSTNDADSLRFRPVSKETEQKLLNLYQNGHSPSSALETLKFDLLIEHGSNYTQVATDRYHCPDKPFCYRLYYKHFGKEFSASTKKDLRNMLNCKIKYYNDLLGDTSLAIGLSGTDHAIGICTPLMKRAHSLPQSGEMVYVEVSEAPSGGNKERYEHYIFLLIAHTPVGGVPLGCILTTNNKAETLVLGFQLLKEVLPAQAFYGRNENGPHTFSVPDSESLQLSLNTSWPGSDVIVCIFRLLQNMWLWLWDEKHNILKDHRLYLLYLAKTLLFASDETEMTDKYQALCADNITVHYPLYLQQMESIWQKSLLWGVCLHRMLPSQDASNYFEAAVRTLKDKFLEYPKMFNIVQLLDFLVTRLDLAYKTKFCNVLQSKVSYVFHSHFPDDIPVHVINSIEEIAGNYFLVPGELGDDKIYTVDAELNTCSCPGGVFGMFCIHQFWIFLKIPSQIFKVTFFDEDFRQKLFSVATGSSLKKQIEVPSTKATELVMEVENSSGVPINICTSTSIEPVFANIPLNEVSNSLSNNNIVSNFPDDNAVVTNHITESTSHPFQNLNIANFPLLKHVPLGDSSNVHSEDKSSTVMNEPNSVLTTSTDTIKNCNTEKLDMEMSKRKNEVLQKFEIFCQRVRDGLDDNTQAFLPALEIMMKNLERKGNTSESLISGLSFFGVLSAPSLCSRTRKKPLQSSSLTEELVPNIYGKQMNTYEKKRSTSLSNSKVTESKGSSAKDADATLKELTLTSSHDH